MVWLSMGDTCGLGSVCGKIKVVGVTIALGESQLVRREKKGRGDVGALVEFGMDVTTVRTSNGSS